MVIIIAIFDVTVPGDKRNGEKENEKAYKKLRKNIRSLKENLQGCGTRQLSQ